MSLFKITHILHLARPSVDLYIYIESILKTQHSYQIKNPFILNSFKVLRENVV
jgi:hypothetical protein